MTTQTERRKCYIFDLDGTLFNCEHRLHHIQKNPQDWTAFFAAVDGDTPIPHMIDLAQRLQSGGADLVFASGRSEECKDETIKGLRRNHLRGGLYMRMAGDHRPDHVIKMELLADIRADGYDPVMVFEDRTQVVAAWRLAGIPCAQVAPGDF